MTNLFTYLSDWKLKYTCALVVLLCLGVGNVWGTTTTITTTSNTSWTVDGRTWTAATDVTAGSSTYLHMKSNSSNITVNSTMSMDLSGTKTVTVTVGAGYYGGKQASVTAKLVNSSGTTISNIGSAQPTSNKNASYSITLTPTDRTVTDVKVVIGVSGATKESKYIRLYSFSIAYTGKPLITLSKTSITGLDYDYGDGPSAAQTFTVTGVELGANITVTAPTNFEVCKTSGGTYTSSVTLTRSGTSVATTTIYVRLAAGKAVGNYGGASTYVTATSTNATTKNVSVSGTVASVAACESNPTIGDASLNGSISLSSFPVQTTGWTVGANCAWSDFGFVWSSSVSTPTLVEATGNASANCTKQQKANSGNATSATHSITGSFSTGVNYYVRGYGKNGYASGTYQYTDVLTITPRSVEFNSNGGSAVDTKYVNSGTKVTAPSDPTKTGYNFGEWQLNSSEFDFANTNVTSNITLVATWTAKTTTISFNQNSGTGGQTGTLTATYDAAMPSAPVTCPTRTGYDFGGYYDGSGGSGTQYYTSTGASARNWDKEDASYTLYAKWTIKNYTITWKVNGETWSDKGGSTNANYNTAWSSLTLPTAPDPENDGCGQKFVGWTTTENYSNATTAPTDLLNADNKSGKTAVLITDNVVFHAVFADYGE